MFDVICVGSATVDAFAQTEEKYYKSKQYRFPVGAKLLIEKLEFHTGGGGTNTAVSFARMGLRVGYVGKVGKGTNSKRVVDALKKEKVDVSLIAREDARTGYSIILNAEGHDRTIFAFKGSNNDLTIKDIKFKKMNTNWLYLSSMMGKSFKAQEKIAIWAKKKGVKVAFNPSSYLVSKGKKHLKKIIDRCDIIVMNDEEAGLLVGGKNIVEKIKRLNKLTKAIYVITEGSKGVHATDGEKIYSIKPKKIRVVDSTGAGDAFASGFLAGMIKKDDISFSLKLGLINAESVIKKFGTKAGLMRYKDISKSMLNNKKIRIRNL